MNNKDSNHKGIYSKLKGFTLVELLVTIAIFVFMTALILARYNNFYAGTIFKNLAYDVALTIRQAQTYGISVKAGSSDFNSAYGVRFNHQTSTTRKYFTLNSYNSNNDIVAEEKKYNFRHDATLYPNGGNYIASSGGNLTLVRYFDIIFRRPNPEPIICGTTSSGTRSCSYTNAEIRIRAGTLNKYVYVYVNSVGQITISERKQSPFI